jgi:ATP-dependent 26S proteasome regulatory subunit
VALERLSQRANSYILETEDKVRIDQFKESLVKCDVSKLFKTQYETFVEYNILRNELRKLNKDGTSTLLPQDMTKSPLQQIDDLLQESKTIAIIHWVLQPAHVDAGRLQDWVSAWSQDSKLYKNHSTVVVFTASQTLFSETVRRLCYTASIETGTDVEHKERLDSLTEKISSGWKSMFSEELPDLAVTEQIVQACRGLNLQQTQTAALKSIFSTPNRTLTVKPFTELKVQILKTSGLEYVEPEYGYERIGGYDLLKKEMNDHVIQPLLDPAKAKYYGLGIPRGVIVDGPPGTGKTVFGHATAKALGLPMIKMTPADLYRGIVGESETRLRNLTNLIESLAPVVVFIDEIDQLFLARNQVMMTDSGVNRRILNGLLEWLGQPNRHSFVFGATNFLENMDEAAIRPGRFDEIVFAMYPNKTARVEIFKVQTQLVRQIPLEKDFDFAPLGDKSFMMSGAEIEKWCLTATRLAMVRGDKFVTMQHFTETEEQMQIDGTQQKERMKSVEHKLEILMKLPNVNKVFLKESMREFAKGEEGSSDAERIAGFLEGLKDENGAKES